MVGYTSNINPGSRLAACSSCSVFCDEDLNYFPFSRFFQAVRSQLFRQMYLAHRNSIVMSCTKY